MGRTAAGTGRPPAEAPTIVSGQRPWWASASPSNRPCNGWWSVTKITLHARNLRGKFVQQLCAVLLESRQSHHKHSLTLQEHRCNTNRFNYSFHSKSGAVPCTWA
nr:uncharacterized protein LOC119162401 [Rhipicephalus microplus]